MANTRKTKTQNSNSISSKRPKYVMTFIAVDFKRIIDVNFDCLEHIFQFLDIEDLINVAEANKQLKVAADVVFNHKYKLFSFWLYNNNMPLAEPIDIYRSLIVIRNLNFTFKILRIFGHLLMRAILR